MNRTPRQKKQVRALNARWTGPDPLLELQARRPANQYLTRRSAAKLLASEFAPVDACELATRELGPVELGEPLDFAALGIFDFGVFDFGELDLGVLEMPPGDYAPPLSAAEFVVDGCVKDKFVIDVLSPPPAIGSPQRNGSSGHAGAPTPDAPRVPDAGALGPLELLRELEESFDRAPASVEPDAGLLGPLELELLREFEESLRQAKSVPVDLMPTTSSAWLDLVPLTPLTPPRRAPRPPPAVKPLQRESQAEREAALAAFWREVDEFQAALQMDPSH